MPRIRQHCSRFLPQWSAEGTMLWIETHQPWPGFVIHQSLTATVVPIDLLNKSTLTFTHWILNIHVTIAINDILYTHIHDERYIYWQNFTILLTPGSFWFWFRVQFSTLSFHLHILEISSCERTHNRKLNLLQFYHTTSYNSMAYDLFASPIQHLIRSHPNLEPNLLITLSAT